MSSILSRNKKRLKRKIRIAKKIKGTENRPRLCVFRSSKHIYAQIIDDVKGITITESSTLCDSIKNNTELTGKKVKAEAVGKLVGQRALEKGIKQVIFDRNGFIYHGRVKAVSDGAREAGLDF